MAWTIMAQVPSPVTDANGDPYSGAVLKVYDVGTTTSIPIAIDDQGASQQATLTANAEGIWEVSGNEVQPFIDRRCKWGIFANATHAAENTPFYMGPFDETPQLVSSGTPTGGTSWTSDNDGPGSGLNADLLDDQQGSYYLDAANLTGNLGSGRFADRSITGVKLETGAVGTTELAGEAVDVDRLGPLAVTEPKIATGAVQARAVADRTLNIDKLFPGPLQLWNYGRGSLGSATIASNQTFAPGVYEYDDLLIDAGFTVTKDTTKPGPLIIKCTGTFTLSGTLRVTNYHDEGDCGGSGGGGGERTISAADFGDVGFGTDIAAGGVAAGAGQDVTLAGFQAAAQGGRLMRGGGAGGTGGGTGSPGVAGRGGGVLIVIANNIVFTSSGLFDVSGEDGATAVTSNNGGGGGGGGGTLIILYKTATAEEEFDAASYDIGGGAGGGANGSGTAGAAGGNGYIYRTLLPEGV